MSESAAKIKLFFRSVIANYSSYRYTARGRSGG